MPGTGVALEVRDDGVGIAPQRLPRALADGHVGLRTSRERVEASGGSFRLESTPGEGTHVRIWLPTRRSSDRLKTWLRAGRRAR